MEIWRPEDLIDGEVIAEAKIVDVNYYMDKPIYNATYQAILSAFLKVGDIHVDFRDIAGRTFDFLHSQLRTHEDYIEYWNQGLVLTHAIQSIKEVRTMRCPKCFKSVHYKNIEDIPRDTQIKCPHCTKVIDLFPK